MCFKIKARILTQRHSFIQLELAGNLKTLFVFETGHRSLFWVVSVLVKQYTECKYGGPLGRRPGRAT